jgi:hypothetical protein
MIRQRLPLLCTAAGRAYLAANPALSEEEAAYFLSKTSSALVLLSLVANGDISEEIREKALSKLLYLKTDFKRYLNQLPVFASIQGKGFRKGIGWLISALKERGREADAFETALKIAKKFSHDASVLGARCPLYPKEALSLLNGTALAVGAFFSEPDRISDEIAKIAAKKTNERSAIVVPVSPFADMSEKAEKTIGKAYPEWLAIRELIFEGSVSDSSVAETFRFFDKNNGFFGRSSPVSTKNLFDVALFFSRDEKAANAVLNLVNTKKGEALLDGEYFSAALMGAAIRLQRG